MEITFDNKKLEKYASNPRLCAQKLGERMSDLFLYRLSQLDAAICLEDLRYVDGHYHELVGDRKGQWACDLVHPYRLVFEPTEKPVPADDSGRSIWTEIRAIEIEEIVDYH